MRRTQNSFVLLSVRPKKAPKARKSKYPESKGNVAAVYSKPLCHRCSPHSHSGGNAETHMDIGEAMGRAMADLLIKDKK